MARISKTTVFLASLALTSLTACGGGGGAGAEVSSVPSPLMPSPSTVSPPARLGLASNQPFATVYASRSNDELPQPSQNEALELRYIAETNSYELKLPGAEKGRLEPYFNAGPVGGAATSTSSRVVTTTGTIADSEVGLVVPNTTDFPYSYTSFGYWEVPSGRTPSGAKIAERGVSSTAYRLKLAMFLEPAAALIRRAFRAT
jgi:hypothetical protein